MENSCVQLDDLPDEILLIIFQKLNNSDALYSLIDVNKRFDIIVSDSIFTRNLTLIPPARKRFDRIVNDATFTRNLILIEPWNGLSCQLTDTILDRFCLQILPKINEKIERLYVESSCMERILLATHFPNLHTLGLYDLAPETACELFFDESYFIHNFQHQLSSLIVNMKQRVHERHLFFERNITIFRHICNQMNNLKYLNFNSSSNYEQLTFGNSPSITFSSNLSELHIVVKTIFDCLCILDGHFDQLRVFYVMMEPSRARSMPLVNNKKQLPNLKCFSLNHADVLFGYNEFFIPLFKRMHNLEDLRMTFLTQCGSVVDGDHIQNNILNHLTKLKEFTFNVYSDVRLDDKVNLPTNDDIQDTFRKFSNDQIISCVDYFPKANVFHCHVYSYPYTWTSYRDITNHFPGGLFTCVREISLHDEHPFEHLFFLRIAQSFPFIDKLTLHNHQLPVHDTQLLPIVQYHRLTKLDLMNSHQNYVEYFLNNTKICLLNKIYLRVRFDSLRKATNDFTSDVTRDNCSKIIGLVFDDRLISLDFKDYFPYADIY